MRKTLIILVCGLLLGVAEAFAISAPQTAIYQNPDAMFLRGKELFAESRYKAALAEFQIFLKMVDKCSEQYQQATFFHAASNALIGSKNALSLLQNYVKEYPVNAYGNELSFLFGLAYFSQNDYEMALDYFQQTNADKLGEQFREDFLFKMGFSLFTTAETLRNEDEKQNRIETAREIFRQLKDSSTTLTDRSKAAVYYYAYCDYLLENYDSALPVFLALENSAEFGNSVQYFIPQIYLGLGNFREAIRRAERILNSNPNDTRNTELYRLLGETYFHENNYLKSLENYSTFENSSTSLTNRILSREDLYFMGVANFKLENYREAIARLSRVTLVDDALAQHAFLFLAQSYLALNDQTNARMSFESAARVEHNAQVRENALFNYAIITYNTAFSPFNESVMAFRAFLDRFPDSEKASQAYEYLANVYLSATNFEEAYNSIITLQTQNPNIVKAKQRLLFNMGVDAFNSPDLTRAIELFNNAIKVSGGDVLVSTKAYFWRGEAYAQTGSPALARADFNSVLSSPKSAEFLPLVHYNIGYTYFAEQNFNAARPYFARFIENESKTTPDKFIDALNRLGDCYFQVRDWNNALRFYGISADRRAPNSDYAIFQIAFIEGLRHNHESKISMLNNLARLFPQSDFIDDALFEKARAHVELNDFRQAIVALDQLTTLHPNSILAPRAIIQKALLNYNLHNTEQAILLYKQVIANYPNSEEAQVAFESLEKLYLEADRVDEFIAFSQQTQGQFTLDRVREDALLFSAAERNFLAGRFAEAITGFERYLKQYPNGSQHIKANFFLADSYLQTGETEKARDLFATIATQKGNPFVEESAGKAAEIYFEQRNFTEAKRFFEIQREVSQSRATMLLASLGILRSEARMLNDEMVLKIATELLSQDIADVDILRELRYYKAKALLELDRSREALPLVQELIKEPRTVQGAEAYFLLADITFTEEKNPEKAEEIIMEFINHGSPHQYWIARSFILLADMAIDAGDDFQAKQYLLSLQNNFRGEEQDIQEEIEIRLREIEEREN